MSVGWAWFCSVGSRVCNGETGMDVKSCNPAVAATVEGGTSCRVLVGSRGPGCLADVSGGVDEVQGKGGEGG
eukprot:1157887-Pelagomonas_calceolata.AAC.9